MLPWPATRMPTVAEYPNTVLSSSRAPGEEVDDVDSRRWPRAPSASGRYGRPPPSTGTRRRSTHREPQRGTRRRPAALSLCPKCSGSAAYVANRNPAPRARGSARLRRPGPAPRRRATPRRARARPSGRSGCCSAVATFESRNTASSLAPTSKSMPTVGRHLRSRPPSPAPPSRSGRGDRADRGWSARCRSRRRSRCAGSWPSAAARVRHPARGCR